MIHLGRVVRFCMVGGVATLTYASSAFALSYGLGSSLLPAAAASLLAYLIAMPVSYLGHKHVTFESDGAHVLEAPRFLASAALGIGISCLVPLAVVNGLGMAPAISIALTCILVPVVNYVVLDRWVFASGEEGRLR
jgi:putative flippase GtrA